MIKVVSIKENSKISELLKFKSVEFNRLTVLLGLNGDGKSSFLNAILTSLSNKSSSGHHKTCADGVIIETDGENICEWYLGREDNGKYRGYFEDVSLDISALFSSEGQSTLNSFYHKLNKVKQLCTKHTDKNIVFFIDEADSGLSVNNIIVLCKMIKDAINLHQNLQVIATANNYEFVETFKGNTLWVATGSYIDFHNYEEYKAFYYGEMFAKFSKERNK